MSSTEPLDVLVVGAGPTGLTAACELARRGVRVRVVERAATPFTGSRGKGIQPRTLEVLDALGVAGRLVATGRFRLPLCFHSPEGVQQVVDMSHGAEPTPEDPWARTLLIPQWRVEQALREHLDRHGTAVEFNRTVTDLVHHDGHVEITFSDGHSTRASYVIGADGGASTVRRLLAVPFTGETDETHRMLLGDVRLDGLDRDHWHLWTLPDGRSLALCPIPATDTFQLQAPLEAEDTSEATLPELQAIVDTVLGSGVVTLHEATWLSRWRLNERLADRFRVDRVFLAGDAAHVHSPAGGQGMNTGIQDAVNLAWKLAAVLQGAEPALLETYEAERQPIAAHTLGMTHRAIGRRPDADDTDDWAEMRQLGITYRGGPLAPPSDLDGPRPGDRAPDAPCHRRDGTPVRLFDLQRGPHWTLYGFDTTPSTSRAEVRPVRIITAGARSDETDVCTVVDTGGHARRAWAARSGELVLVRPDGHLAVRATDPDTAAAYLDHVLGATATV